MSGQQAVIRSAAVQQKKMVSIVYLKINTVQIVTKSLIKWLTESRMTTVPKTFDKLRDSSTGKYK